MLKASVGSIHRPEYIRELYIETVRLVVKIIEFRVVRLDHAIVLSSVFLP